MSDIDHQTLTNALLGPVLEAGRIQLGYFRSGIAVESKADRSPVTAADREAEAVILSALAVISPPCPVIAEEQSASGTSPHVGDRFFLVDPLDGTRDFIAGHDDFTINIALVQDRRPVFGLVYAPAKRELFVTLGPDHGVSAVIDCAATSVRIEDVPQRRLTGRDVPPGGLTALVSPWRPREPVDRALDGHRVAAYVRAGSSFKFCLLATGAGDVYPQPGPTSEWDTAAGQAIVEAAGGVVLDFDGRPLTYGNSGRGYLNSAFIAWGRRPQPD